jgi:hypothetical protein
VRAFFLPVRAADGSVRANFDARNVTDERCARNLCRCVSNFSRCVQFAGGAGQSSRVRDFFVRGRAFSFAGSV